MGWGEEAGKGVPRDKDPERESCYKFLEEGRDSNKLNLKANLELTAGPQQVTSTHIFSYDLL